MSWRPGEGVGLGQGVWSDGQVDGKISIRAGATNDTGSVVPVDPIALSDDGTRARAIEGWLAAGVARVAEVDGRTVGYCVVEATFFGHEFVTMVMVARDARGQGVGAALLDDAWRRCRTTKMFTSTNLSNHVMQRLLARAGWRSAGIVYGLDDDPELFFRAPDHPQGLAGR